MKYFSDYFSHIFDTKSENLTILFSETYTTLWKTFSIHFRQPPVPRFVLPLFRPPFPPRRVMPQSTWPGRNARMAGYLKQ